MEDNSWVENTLEWAKKFRDAAAELEAVEPPEGINPLLWRAMKNSYISTAEDLEEQAKEAKR